jgi:hypothetical protein
MVSIYLCSDALSPKHLLGGKLPPTSEVVNVRPHLLLAQLVDGITVEIQQPEFTAEI